MKLHEWVLIVLLTLTMVVGFFGGPEVRFSCSVGTAPEEEHNSEILDAIWDLESGRADYLEGLGPSGELGPYQITEAYWEDAGRLGSWQDCRDADYSRRVVVAYMKRWVPEAWEAGDAETIMRTHNGGPRGGSKDSTLDYWTRGRKLLDQ